MTFDYSAGRVPAMYWPRYWAAGVPFLLFPRFGPPGAGRRHAESHRVAGFQFRLQVPYIVYGSHRLPVDGDDNVAFLQTDLLRKRIFLHLRDDNSTAFPSSADCFSVSLAGRREMPNRADFASFLPTHSGLFFLVEAGIVSGNASCSSRSAIVSFRSTFLPARSTVTSGF